MTELFDGTKKTYFRIALLFGLIFFGGFTLGFIGLKYILQGENWLNNGPFLLTMVVVAVIYIWLHTKNMYSYDRKGMAGEWEMKETTVKLPYEAD